MIARREYCIKRPTFEQRLWHGIQIGGFDECWPWIRKAKHHFGYGVIRRSGCRKMVATHRAVYEVVRGPVPEGLNVCHTCDNPSCCNPFHLVADTQKSNVNQAIQRGRLTWKSGPENPLYGNPGPTGYDHPHHKFTPEDVAEIRKLFWEYGLTQYQIAKVFSSASSTIWYAANMVRYNHPPS